MKGKKLSYKEKVAKLEASANERRKLFDRLLAHLSRGYSFESFSEVSSRWLRRMLEVHKEDFSEEEIEQAMSQGRAWWEDVGHRQANGQCLGNSRTWYYNMSNRYGWREKVDVQAEHKGQVAVSIVSYASTKQSPSDT